MTHRPPQPAPYRRRSRGAYWFLVPNGLGFLLFTLLPVLAALALALSRWDPLEGWHGLHWAGLGNFVEILSFHRDAGRVVATDPAFWQSLYNTLYLMIGIPIGMAASLFTALLLNQKLRGIVLWRALFFVPTICSAVAVAALWKWIYQPDVGLLNGGLRAVGLSGPDWLGDPVWAKPALILMGLWVGVGGYNAVLYLAGLQNIPPELYEAAAIDGAGFWQRLRYITWPQLAPTTFFILVMSIIGGFQGHFVAIHLMTAGGPAGSTTTLLYYLYQQAFQWHQMGYACALAVVLLALVFLFTLLQWRHGGQGLRSQY
jgi:multiple sugar transport system permease protein